MSWFNFSFQDFAFAFLSVLFEGIPFLLLGAPIVSPIVALSTWQAFSQSPQGPLVMTALRLGIGFILAVGVGFFVHSLRAEKILQPALLGDGVDVRRRGGLSVAATPVTVQNDFNQLVAGASL